MLKVINSTAGGECKLIHTFAQICILYIYEMRVQIWLHGIWGGEFVYREPDSPEGHFHLRFAFRTAFITTENSLAYVPEIGVYYLDRHLTGSCHVRNV